jgi:hypothetical protein
MTDICDSYNLLFITIYQLLNNIYIINSKLFYNPLASVFNALLAHSVNASPSEAKIARNENLSDTTDAWLFIFGAETLSGPEGATSFSAYYCCLGVHPKNGKALIKLHKSENAGILTPAAADCTY